MVHHRDIDCEVSMGCIIFEAARVDSEPACYSEFAGVSVDTIAIAAISFIGAGEAACLLPIIHSPDFELSSEAIGYPAADFQAAQSGWSKKRDKW